MYVEGFFENILNEIIVFGNVIKQGLIRLLVCTRVFNYFMITYNLCPHSPEKKSFSGQFFMQFCGALKNTFWDIEALNVEK